MPAHWALERSSVVIVGTVHVARHSLLDIEIGGKSRPTDRHEIDDQRKGLLRIVTFSTKFSVSTTKSSIDNQFDNRISDPHNGKAETQNSNRNIAIRSYSGCLPSLVSPDLPSRRFRFPRNIEALESSSHSKFQSDGSYCP